eukprot:m.9786 g.9786  ORF g.9786 m.9786 type:complete len:476 (-) comp5473_c0_seq2:72-1499(-)
MRLSARKAILAAVAVCSVTLLLLHPEMFSFGPAEELHSKKGLTEHLNANDHKPSPKDAPGEPHHASPDQRQPKEKTPHEQSAPTRRQTTAGPPSSTTTTVKKEHAPIPVFDFQGSATKMLETANLLNTQQTIYNSERFSLDFSNPALVVIVIMVHKRADYLEASLASLRGVPDISSALLVLSHDYVDEAMEKAVKTIDFCAYMRIFSPHSTQFHPHDFPGEDPKDCARDLSKEAAIQSKCNNALHPDTYGHYRESKFCAIKHHWWWKAAFVFDSIRVLANYQGPMLFLEEDYAVVPDVLSVLRQAAALVPNECPDCAFITLGTYDNAMGLGPDAIALTSWQSVRHNMGMVFDRSTWRRLRGCARQFCTYDDYNWDWTLAHLQRSGCAGPMRAAVIGVARVHHLGVCGMHAHAADCDPHKAFQEHLNAVHQIEKHMFPRQLRTVAVAGEQHLGQPNGGWGDVRDHALCLSMVGETL